MLPFLWITPKNYTTENCNRFNLLPDSSRPLPSKKIKCSAVKGFGTDMTNVCSKENKDLK